MKRKSFSTVTLLFVIFWFSGVATADILKFYPVADSAVQLDSYMGGNQNLLTNLLTQSYLKFDLSEIQGSVILSAALHAYQFQLETPLPLPSGTTLFFVQDDSWNDSDVPPDAIGGDNKPSISTLQLGYNPNNPDYIGWSSWVFDKDPGTGLLPAELELLSGDYVWSMALVEENFLGEHLFYSREFEFVVGQDPDLRPYLEVVTAPIPVPCTVFLLGSGLAGLAGLRRFLRTS